MKLRLALIVGVMLSLGSISAQALYLYGDGTGCPGNWNAATKTCTLTADWINYDGITIYDADGLTLDCAGYMIQVEGHGPDPTNVSIQYNSKNVTVKNCTLTPANEGASSQCLRVSGSGHLITDNEFIGCSGAIRGQMEHVTITRNTLTDIHDVAIVLYYNPPHSGQLFNTISDNTFNGGYYGISLNSTHNTITGNQILNQSHTGIGFFPAGGSNNLVEGNVIKGAGLVGLSINSGQYNTIRCNEITENGIGIAFKTHPPSPYPWPAPSDNVINNNSVFGNIQYELQQVTGENNDLTSNYWGPAPPVCSQFSGISCPADLEPYLSDGIGDACGFINVSIDIKPGSDPNCINNDGHGVIPVAILGSAEFDVTVVNQDTVTLSGMAVKVVGKSNKLLAHIGDVNNDNFDDLVMQIEDIDGMLTTGTGTAELTGNLFDGTPILGADAICIVP